MFRLTQILALVCLAPALSRANLLAYDPFFAGGAAPNAAAGEYQTGTGYTGDFINGQAPAATGFAPAGWVTGGTYAGTVYYRTEAGQLSYTDGAGDSLTTAGGQLNLLRSAGTSATDKDASRNLDIGGNLPGTLYLSLLVSVSAGDILTVRSGTTDGVESRRFNFGINAAGNPYVTGTFSGGSTQNANGSVVAAPSTPHLLVVRLRDVGTSNDEVALFLDPLLGSEGLNTPVAQMTTGFFYVGGNPAWTLQDIFFRNQVIDSPSSIVMDEIRVGTTWDDVTPHAAVPEPASLGLLLLGAVLLRKAGSPRANPW